MLAAKKRFPSNPWRCFLFFYRDFVCWRLLWLLKKSRSKFEYFLWAPSERTFQSFCKELLVKVCYQCEFHYFVSVYITGFKWCDVFYILFHHKNVPRCEKAECLLSIFSIRNEKKQKDGCWFYDGKNYIQ